MASVSERDCIVCSRIRELWMPGALCSECAAFAPRTADPLQWAGPDVVIRPLGRRTLPAWKRAKAVELGMPAGSGAEGFALPGEITDKKWQGFLYRWVGVRVSAVEDPPWPELRAGELHYQQWERTVLFPDRRLWLTVRWHPDRKEWIEAAPVTSKGEWDHLKRGLDALREISTKGRKPYETRYFNTPEDFREACETATRTVEERTTKKPTQYEVAAEMGLSRSRFNDYKREYGGALNSSD